jgi:hypothetical protein
MHICRLLLDRQVASIAAAPDWHWTADGTGKKGDQFSPDLLPTRKKLTQGGSFVTSHQH